MDELLGCSVADGFHHLLCDFPDCLNSACSANIKVSIFIRTIHVSMLDYMYVIVCNEIV